MASSANDKKDGRIGVIVLGNSGAGKSYLCNLLLGKFEFETGYDPETVTRYTENRDILIDDKQLQIFNIPGLIEVNQDAIDRNKNEIKRAFEMCHQSIVVFIWRETGGRAQNEDVIAFNALNNAYCFPPDSLLFVVNNVSPNRPSEFDARFMITLSKLLKQITVSVKNTLFIDKVNSSNANAIADSHQQLWLYLSKLIPFTHRKEVEIRLQLDEIGELNALLKKQQDETELDKQALQREIDEMNIQYVMMKLENEQQIRAWKHKVQEPNEISNKAATRTGSLAEVFSQFYRIMSQTVSQGRAYANSLEEKNKADDMKTTEGREKLVMNQGTGRKHSDNSSKDIVFKGSVTFVVNMTRQLNRENNDQIE